MTQRGPHPAQVTKKMRICFIYVTQLRARSAAFTFSDWRALSMFAHMKRSVRAWPALAAFATANAKFCVLKDPGRPAGSPKCALPFTPMFSIMHCDRSPVQCVVHDAAPRLTDHPSDRRPSTGRFLPSTDARNKEQIDAFKKAYSVTNPMDALHKARDQRKRLRDQDPIPQPAAPTTLLASDRKRVRKRPAAAASEAATPPHVRPVAAPLRRRLVTAEDSNPQQAPGSASSSSCGPSPLGQLWEYI